VNSHYAKLNEAQVKQIRKKLSKGALLRDIMEEYKKFQILEIFKLA